MNNQESGRLGGIATRDNHPTYCPECKQLMKSKFYSEKGQKGGRTAAERAGKNGSPSMSERGQLGGRGNKRNGTGGDHSLCAGRVD